MKHLFILLFCFSCLVGFPQTSSIQKSPALTQAPPTSEGFSPERLARIDKMLEQAVTEQQIPGAVALIARNGKIIYHKAFGMANNSDNRPLKKDDIFRLASQTKAITSTAVMMLWEEGKFRLDDPVSKYIPEFEGARVLETFNDADSSYTTIPADKPVTLRHLLTHTSGIGYGVIDGDERFRKIFAKAGIVDLFTTEPVSIEENIKKLAKLPLHHHPGEKFTYGESLDVLGYFIELQSGMPLDEFFRSRIFEPLGMKDTYFYVPDSKSSRLVPIQTMNNGNWTEYPVTFYDPDYPVKGQKTFFSGGAGLSGTATDYAAFLQMFLNKGEYNGKRLLSRTTVDLLLANHTKDLLEGSGTYYGLAFGVINEAGEASGGRGSQGTFEWGGYFNTQYFADPAEGVIGILMKQTQDISSDETAWKFRQLVGQAIDN